MRILLTADTLGGVWTYALELCHALQQHHVEVLLATMGAPLNAEQRRQLHALQNVQLAESSYKLEWMNEPWKDVEAAGQWLLELERQFSPDVIHLNGYVHGRLPWRAPVLIAAHSCVLSWWQAVKHEPAPPSWSNYRDRVEAGLCAADLVVAPTHAMLETVLQHYGPLPVTRVIANGRRSELFHRRGRKQSIVFAAGRLWDEAKNLSALDRVASGIDWPVCVAGSARGPDGDGVSATHVRCLGQLPQDDLVKWLAQSAIYAMPARYEPFGLSALEAALSGCCLVLGDVPSLREVWDDSAVFVDPENHCELRSALRTLTARPGKCRQFAWRAAQRAQRYSPQRMADAYDSAYRAMISRRQPAHEAADARTAGGLWSA